MFGGFGLFQEQFRPFNNLYRCYSVAMSGTERSDIEKGGKIIMPPSALDTLTRLNIVYPMLFRLTNCRHNRFTHCGVLEFVADEGKVFLPYWMMKNLYLEEGSMVQVESASLPVATFSKFQPQAPDFLDIHNQKAVLENALRNFACLTTGDVIAINYNDKVYELCVLETKPGSAVSIIECDMNVEFAAPVGYKEPQRLGNNHITEDDENIGEVSESEDMSTDTQTSFLPFVCKGHRLDGKNKELSPNETTNGKTVARSQRRGIPDYDYKLGIVRFIRTTKPTVKTDQTNDKKSDFEAFKGDGKPLVTRRHN
ncbi:ubiquitin recognition factor in ER-associated degradation protein 1-like [Oppia nitens]|uniref:ubiquitin recognition factor in ER-associated degradation protein 1-like n=1 Tax=Oppia nitens TaxID=1686743 RepID=UPI0023DC4A7C|nr:ubiquitin recognition factor in ER-associated degradation protein 1-like [Oppia nitens]